MKPTKEHRQFASSSSVFLAWLSAQIFTLPLLLAAVLCAATAAIAADPAHAKRPNVLFLIADDLRTELGCYGVAGIQTPHLDALAARSVRFNRAYVQYPLCAPQRISLLAGLYPTQTSVFDNRQPWGREHSDWKVLPRHFRDHGYNTITVGKVFHNPGDFPGAWTEGPAPRRNADNADNAPEPAKVAGGKRGGRNPAADPAPKAQNFNNPGPLDRPIVLPGNGETFSDYERATRAIDMLKQYKDASQPFFLICGFTNPHSPPRAPQKFYDLYDVNKIPLPVDFASRPTVPPGFPAVSVAPRNTDLFIGNREASEAAAREMKRAYWAATSFMDEQAGRVLRALDEFGLRDNTIVVFWGDHGYHLGEKGRWSKAYSLFDVALRVPFLIAVPGLTPPRGAVCERPVEVLNLYRTLADVCGLPVPPDEIEGESLRPLLRDATATWNRPVFSAVAYQPDYSVAAFQGALGRSVRTESWRYSQWVEGELGEVLFDVQNDPHELKNLAADPRYATQLAEMRALLAKMPGRKR
jgi:iduronate 2-sulfatase